MGTSYRFAPQVRTVFAVTSVLCAILVVTLPIAIWWMLSSRTARLVFDATGMTVRGMGGTQRWEFGELERLGILAIEIRGGGPLVAVNGGATAMNLVGITRSGKTLKFMLSRFERWEEILAHVERSTKLPIESVRRGLVGVAWPPKQTAGGA